MKQSQMMDGLTKLAETIDIAHATVHGELCGQDTETYQEMTVNELAFLMNMTQSIYEEADSVKKQLGKMYDDLRVIQIPTKMDDEGIESQKITDLGLLMLTDDLRVKVEDKEAEFEWLETTLNGDLIQDTVNAGSLKALLRRRLKAGEEVPSDIFTVTPFTRASIKKR
tara:strand:+ start:13297 stop:13800 length:504 start_codon:yes stop_codon:yes gene_type:complete